MAARDVTTGKGAIVNALIGTDKEEEKILAGGESRKQYRSLKSQKQVTKVIPNAEEQSIMHNLFTKTVDLNEISLKKRNLPPNCVWMSDCTLTNLIFSHPENRNLHNKVFGGFIMRQALELSWALGFTFSKSRIIIKGISDISFNKSIAVNSLIHMNAYVVYTNKTFFQITLYVETWDVTFQKTDTTNSFHFTFEAPDVVNEVVPHSYHEAMMYIDGFRHFQSIMTKTKMKNPDTSK